MKNLNSILLIGGVGALIYFMMNKSKGTSKSVVTPSSSGKTIMDKINFYFPMTKDEKYKKAFAEAMTKDGKPVTDEQLIEAITKDLKERDPKKTPEDFVKSLTDSLTDIQTRADIDADKKISAEKKALTPSREDFKKLLDSKETAIMKFLIFQLVMGATFVIAFSTPSVAPMSSGKNSTSTKDNKNTTQSKEVENFIGMSMI